MRYLIKFLLLLLIISGSYTHANCQTSGNLRIVVVRHGEKEATGDNLNCQGLNRSLALPKVIVTKFGTPSHIYVPSLNSKKSVSHARMFQTASPLAIKYNLGLDARYDVEDYAGLAQDVQKRNGTVVIVWEHKAMDNLLRAFGVKTKGLKWGDNDFDSIWIVTYKNGKAEISTDKEGLTPAAGCPF